MHKCCNQVRRSSGFTLVEVLVASTILAVVLTTTLGVYASGVAGSRQNADYQRALAVATARIAEFGHAADEVTPGRREGETEDGFRWQTTVSEMESTTDFPEASGIPAVIPYQVHVQVVWGGNERERMVELHSLRMGKR